MTFSFQSLRLEQSDKATTGLEPVFALTEPICVRESGGRVTELGKRGYCSIPECGRRLGEMARWTGHYRNTRFKLCHQCAPSRYRDVCALIDTMLEQEAA